MFEEDCLRLYGAEFRAFAGGSLLFSRGEEIVHYFQVVSGLITFAQVDSEGNNIIGTILGRGEGNYTTLIEHSSSFDVIAITDCTVFLMPKESFIDMITSEKGMMMHILKYLSEQLYNCMETNRMELNKSPSSKITELFQFLKFEETDQELFSLQIDLDIDQIAMMSGLSAEICIATIQKMEKDNSIKIRGGKIYF